MTGSAELVAFELTAAAKSDFSGGSVAYGDGRTIDLGEAFASRSTIVVDAESVAVEALDGHPALKRAKKPSAGSKPTHEVEVDVSAQPDPAAEDDAPDEIVANAGEDVDESSSSSSSD